MNAPYRQTCAMATVSLIFGILGWTLIPCIGSLIAIVTGHLARAEIRRNPESLEGDGMAVAGLVLGWLMVALSLIAFVAIVLFLGGLAAFLAVVGAANA